MSEFSFAEYPPIFYCLEVTLPEDLPATDSDTGRPWKQVIGELTRDAYARVTYNPRGPYTGQAENKLFVSFAGYPCDLGRLVREITCDLLEEFGVEATIQASKEPA